LGDCLLWEVVLKNAEVAQNFERLFCYQVTKTRWAIFKQTHLSGHPGGEVVNV
jgi:hypothetical protein